MSQETETRNTFVLPNFTEVEGYDPTGFFEWALKQKDKSVSNRKIIHGSLKHFPWMDQVVVRAGITSPVSGLIPERVPSKLRSFRPYGFHLDDINFGTRLRLLADFKPAMVVSGTFVTHGNQVSNHAFVASMNTMYGETWLEQAIGLAQVNIEYGIHGTAANFVKKIEDLQVIPMSPGVIADGATDTFLHSSALLNPEDFTDGYARRVLYRTQYTPTE